MKRLEKDELILRIDVLETEISVLVFNRNRIIDTLNESLLRTPETDKLNAELDQIKADLAEKRPKLRYYKLKLINYDKDPKRAKRYLPKKVIAGRVLETVHDDLVKRYGTPQKAIEALVEYEQKLWE